MIRGSWLAVGVAVLLGACGDATQSEERPVEDVGSTQANLTKGTPGAKIGDSDYCNDAANKCALGEGDCDSSSQCQTGLACVPGNLTKRGAFSGDACAPASCGDGVKNGDETSIDCGGSCGWDCVISCDAANGSSSKCSTDCPCTVGEGDCDGATQCQAGLVCGTGNGPAFQLPAGTDVCWGSHCQNGAKDGDETAVDCGGSCAPCTPPTAGSVSVASQGAALLPITIAPHSDSALHSQVVTIANELRDKLNAIIGPGGARFAVSASTNVPTGISLGLDGDFPGVGWPYQGFFRPNDLYAAGVLQPQRLLLREQYVLHTPQGSSRVIVAGATIDGLRHAASDLLRRAGYRHLAQTATWEVTPLKPSLSFNLAVNEKPAFASRAITFTQSFFSGEQAAFDAELNGWRRHNRMGGLSALAPSLAYNSIISSWATRHGQPFPPALTTKNNSTPGDNQFCLTAVALVGGQQVTALDAVREWALLQTTPYVISVTPNAGVSWTSSTCNDVNDPTYGNIANRIAAVANAAASAVPTKAITVRLTDDVNATPTIAIRQNVFMVVNSYYATPTPFSLENRLSAWSASTVEGGILDFLGESKAERPGPSVVSTKDTVERLLKLYQAGARQYSVNEPAGWGMPGPSPWVLAEVLWDADAPKSIEDYRTDFFESGFASAAPDIRKYYDVLENHPVWSESLIGSMYYALQQGFLHTSDVAVQTRIADLAIYTRYLELYRKFWNRCSAQAPATEQAELKELLQFIYSTRDTRMVRTREAMGAIMADTAQVVCPVEACAPGEPASQCSSSFVRCASNGCINSHNQQTGVACSMPEWHVACPTATATSTCPTCYGSYPPGSSCNETKNGVRPTFAQIPTLLSAGVANNAVLVPALLRQFTKDLVPHTPENPQLPVRNSTVYTKDPHYLYVQRPSSAGPLTVHVKKYAAGGLIYGRLSQLLNGGPVDNRLLDAGIAETDWVFPNASSAVHRLDLDDLSDRMFTSVPSDTRLALPVGIDDRPLALNYRWSGYFLVPAGTQNVVGWSESDGQYFRYRKDSSGAWHTDSGYFSDYAVGHACTSPRITISTTLGQTLDDHFVVPVDPPATQDEIWLFHDGSAGTVGGRQLLSVPPYLFSAPAQMLAPREVVGGLPGSCEGVTCSAETYCVNGACQPRGEAHDLCSEGSCLPGLVCAGGYGPAYGYERGTDVCLDPQCLLSPETLGCGYEGAPCPCDTAVVCASNEDCPGEEVCVEDGGDKVGLPGADVCMPQECPDGPCGSRTAVCGECACTPDCSTKTCGSERGDGCKGECLATCGPRQTGCRDDADCPENYACVLGGASRVGGPTGENACLPRQCTLPDILRQSCGELSDTCGLCPELPSDVCANRECGRDPSYGTVCGPLNVPCIQGKIIAPFGPSDLNLSTAPRPGVPSATIEPLLLTETATDSSPGALVGSFGVDSRGGATYTIPIVAVPGRAGMTPSVSLNYSSKKGNGIAGVGWSLGGLSTIARCAKTSGTDGWAVQIAYDSLDALCLDGQRLVRTVHSVAHFTDGATYRTEVDSLEKITYRSSNGSDYFVRQLPDGRILKYGSDSGSRLEREISGKGIVTKAWALATIADRVGNFSHYEYGKLDGVEPRSGETTALDTIELFLASVAYGGIESPRGNAPHSREITFEYQYRDDYMDGFTPSGSRVARTKRLKAIKTWIGGHEVGSYTLNYQMAPNGLPDNLQGAPAVGVLGPSRLISVTECSKKNGVRVCMRPTEFTYQDEGGFHPNSTAISFVPADSTGPLIRIDFNGDGRDDFLTTRYPSLGPPIWVVMLSTGGRANPGFREVILGLWKNTQSGSGEQAPCFSADSVADLDGDGADDVIDLCRDKRPIAGTARWAYRYYSFAGTDENPGFTHVDIPVNGDSSEAARAALVDIDGDGLKDIFECVRVDHNERGQSQYYAAQGTTFDPTPRGVVTPDGNWGSCYALDYRNPGNENEGDTPQIYLPPSPLLVQDVNGDGQGDVLFWRADQDGLDGSSLVDNYGWARYYVTPEGYGGWQRVTFGGSFTQEVVTDGAFKFMDVNGDGLVDLVYLAKDGLQLSINHGGVFSKSRKFVRAGTDPFLLERITKYSLRNSIGIDYDGDGADDLLRLLEPRDGDPAGAGAHWLLDRTNTHELQHESLTLDTAPFSLTDPDRSFLSVQPGVEPLRAAGKKFPTFTLADVDGDSSPDLVQLRQDGKVVVTYGNFGQANLLESVVDGLGKRINVQYEHTSNFTDGSTELTYTPAPECLHSDGVPKTRCLKHIGPLVSRYEIVGEHDSTSDPDMRFRYRYEDARAGLFGRGWLGFGVTTIEQNQATSPDTFIERTVIYRDNATATGFPQVFPFADQEIFRITTTGTAQSPAEKNASFARTMKQLLWDQSNTTLGGKHPFVKKSITTQQEVAAGAVLNVRTTESEVTQVDLLGNIRSVTTTVKGAGVPVATSTIERDFDDSAARIAAWQIGLKTDETVSEEIFGTSSDATEAERVMRWTYDEYGLLSSQVREPDAAQDSSYYLATTFARTNDAYVNLRSVTVAGGWRHGSEQPIQESRTTTYQYDNSGISTRRVIRHVGNDCPATATPNDSQNTGLGTTCLIADMKYDPRDGSLLAWVNPAGIASRSSYDAFGRIRETTDAVQSVFVEYFDAVTSTDAKLRPVHSRMEIAVRNQTTGASSSQFLDALGRVVQTETLGLDGEPLFQEYEYEWGEVLERVSRPHPEADASQGEIRNSYDARWRLKSQLAADLKSTTFLYGAAGNLTDALVLEGTERTLVGTEDPKHHVSVRFQDVKGRTLRSRDANNTNTRYVYDAFGTLGRITDAHGNVTEIVSDRLGRMTEHSDGDSGVQAFWYTAFDDLFVHEDGVGSDMDRKRTLSYDDAGRLTAETSSVDGVTTFAYDVGPNALGRMVASTSPTGVTEHFDFEAPSANGDVLSNRGRVRHVSRSIAGVTFDSSIGYAANGLVGRLDYPESAGGSGFAVEYGYDDAGNVSSIVGTNAAGTAVDSTIWERTDAYKGLALSREAFGSGEIHSSYTYQDKTGRPSSIATLAADGTSLQDVAYNSYDDNGNLTGRSTLLRQTDGTTESHVEAFGYDVLDRLTLAERNGQATNIGYDALGNISSKDGVGLYAYVEQGKVFRPHAVQSVQQSGVKVLDLRYDAVGNVVHRSGQSVSGGSQDLSYTSFNLPKEVTLGNGGRIAYQYDAARQRALATEGDCSNANDPTCRRRFYVGDGYERYVGTDASGLFARHTYKVFVGGREVAEVQRETRGATTTEKRLYLHSDHLGSAQVVTDVQGHVVDARKFSAFGELSSAASSRSVRVGFTGHESDFETGLVNMRGRLYDARLGRFLQADPPFAESPLWSQGLNRYSYVSNNPLVLVDPSGFAGEDGGFDRNGYYCSANYCSHADPSSDGIEVIPRADYDADALWQTISNDDLSESNGGVREHVAREQERDRASSAAVQQEADWEAAKQGLWDAYLGAVDEGLDSLGRTSSAANALQGAIDTSRWRSNAPTDGRARQQYEFARTGLTAVLFALSTVLTPSAAIEKGAARVGAAGEVVLDANTLINALEKGQLDDVLKAMDGRAPVVPWIAAREFLEKGSADVLRAFIAAHGGRMGAPQSGQAVGKLRTQAAVIGRNLKLNDARVGATAQAEGLSVITQDKRFRNFLNWVGIGGQKY